ncbi:MAG: hypothetical protein RQ754_12650 [Desulfuromonadales bacterium]|nr:hypothetical protein [Desulfuromonadales bacterium]
MKKVFFWMIVIGLFALSTVLPGFASTPQQVDSDAAQQTPAEEQSSPEPGSTVEIAGVVVAIDSDADGNPELVKVQNHTISEYGRGLDLFDHVGAKVKIIGEIFVDGDGQVLDVIEYEVVEEASPK